MFLLNMRMHVNAYNVRIYVCQVSNNIIIQSCTPPSFDRIIAWCCYNDLCTLANAVRMHPYFLAVF